MSCVASLQPFASFRYFFFLLLFFSFFLFFLPSRKVHSMFFAGLKTSAVHKSGGASVAGRSAVYQRRGTVCEQVFFF